MDEWLFVSGTPLDDWFGQQLLALTDGHDIVRVVKEKLDAIQQSPVTPDPLIVNGEPVHIVKTGQFTTGADRMTPALLILYVLDHANRFIHLMHITEARKVDLGTGSQENFSGEPGEELLSPHARDHYDRAGPEPVAHMLRRILAQASRLRRH